MTEGIKVIKPIAFWKTRSFWFGWFPAAVTLFDVAMQQLDTPTGAIVAESIAYFLSLMGFDVDGAHVATFMRMIAPIYALIVAQQRSGITRPYTASAAKEQTIAEVVSDGKSAFEAGKRIGAALKK